MFENAQAFFSSEHFMPHGHCYLWRPALLWLQVLSNGLIGLAYVFISGHLAYLVYRVRDLPFKATYLAFGIFIVSCGVTHLMDVWVIWEPRYWLDGSIRAVTAVASLGTALMLPPLVPKVIALARGLRTAHDRGLELESAVRALGTLNERMREVDQLKTEFFANVSHELRTPLALVLGPVERLLASERLEPEARADLEVVARNARGLLRRVNDLLDLAKLDAGRMRPHYARVDLAQLLRLVADSFEGLTRERSMRLDVDAPATVPAEVDPDKVQRLVVNLLSNAFRFTPPNGTVRCSLSVLNAERAVVEVADSGPGIPREEREVVFERFRQGRGGADGGGGTGLGLSIVRDFAALHGGGVTVGDAPEGGALFRVELPLRAPAGAEVARAPSANRSAKVALQSAMEALARPAQAAASFAGHEVRAEGAPSVLVVEDNADMARFISQTLGEVARVSHAPDGQAGLEAARALRPDLVVSDVMMPRLSGDRLVTLLRQELPQVAILVLSAKADEELRVELLKAGANDYVMKPFRAEELRARARNLLVAKRARDVLSTALASRGLDLEALSLELAARKGALESAVEQMRLARDEAARANETKTNFLSMVSHELRTPLTTIQLQLDRLVRDKGHPLSPRQLEMVDRIHLSSARLLSLIESILEYSRLENGKLRPMPGAVDLTALVHDTVEELRPRADRKQLALRVDAEGPVRLSTDPRLLRLVLGNLVENAIKYTPQGGVAVTVRLESNGHPVGVLQVSDTGPGIAPEHQQLVFQPFEQLEDVRRKHLPGVGLGLALVRQLVETLGGTVELSSELGKGCTFTVRLPSLAIATHREDASWEQS